MIYLGLDPGVLGGVAALEDDGTVRLAVRMPATERDLLTALELAIWGEPCGHLPTPARAAVERVGAFPGMGVVSAFTFGKGYGALLMALTASKIPFDIVQPLAWQKALGCLTRGDKNVSKRRAQQLFPDQTVTHAIADALLLAEFCRRTHRRQGESHASESRPSRAHPQTSPETVPRRRREGAEGPAPQAAANAAPAGHGGPAHQGPRRRVPVDRGSARGEERAPGDGGGPPDRGAEGDAQARENDLAPRRRRARARPGRGEAARADVEGTGDR